MKWTPGRIFLAIYFTGALIFVGDTFLKYRALMQDSEQISERLKDLPPRQEASATGCVDGQPCASVQPVKPWPTPFPTTEAPVKAEESDAFKTLLLSFPLVALLYLVGTTAWNWYKSPETILTTEERNIRLIKYGLMIQGWVALIELVRLYLGK